MQTGIPFSTIAGFHRPKVILPPLTRAGRIERVLRGGFFGWRYGAKIRGCKAFVDGTDPPMATTFRYEASRDMNFPLLNEAQRACIARSDEGLTGRPLVEGGSDVVEALWSAPLATVARGAEDLA